MRIKLLLLLTFLLTTSSLFAQTTNLTLQVTDTAVQTWNNGTWSVLLLTSSGRPTSFFNIGTTTPVPGQSQSGVLNGTGSASITLTQNVGIAPLGSIWQFTVCSQTTATNPCFIQPVTVTASTSLTITPPPPIVIAGIAPGAVAYADSEVLAGIGQLYYNTVSQTNRVCQVATGNTCTTWTSSGGGSGSGIPYGTGGGTAQAQTVTTTPNITALTTGTYVTWLPTAANTAAAPTLAAGTTAATAITKCGTVALVAGDLLSTVWAVAQYDGTEWVLQNPVQFGCSEGGLPTSGGTANAQTLTVSPAITAYITGAVLNFTPGVANTGATTVAVSGLSTKNITKCGTTALVANDLTVAATAVILYDGTEFQLLNPQATACGGVGNSILLASNYPGTGTGDCGDKIKQALSLLPNASGIIYVNQSCGLTITTAFTVGASEEVLWVQGGTWTQSAVITNGGILAAQLPGAIGGALGADSAPVVIKQANSVNLAEMVLLSGQAVSIGHITFDGNQANNSTAGPCFSTSTAPRYLIEDTQVTQCKTDGLDISSGSSGGKIIHSTFNNNGQDGVNCNSAQDTWISQSELSGNTRDGTHWVDCPGLRLVHNDLTANTRFGLYGAGTVAGLHSTNFVVVANDWTNLQEDIEADGTVGGTGAVNGWAVEGNNFVGSTNRTDATYPNILLFNTGYHNIVANNFVNPTSHRTTFAIQDLNTGTSAPSNIGNNVYASPSTFFSTAPVSLLSGATQDTGTITYQGSCSGTATSSVTIVLYGMGQNTALTCTVTSGTLGRVVDHASTISNLGVTATHAGFSASSGVVTVMKNGGATTVTCTIGTGTSCNDSTHFVSTIPGDVISIQFTTQATEVLAGVSAAVFLP